VQVFGLVFDDGDEGNESLEMDQKN
jgi:hypothetical protein